MITLLAVSLFACGGGGGGSVNDSGGDNTSATLVSIIVSPA